MSALTINTQPARGLPDDFVGPPIREKIDTEVAVSVATESALNEDDLALADCRQTGVLESGTESADNATITVSLIRKFGSLSSIVRVAGVAAMVVSMCLFLIEGMGVVNDTQRFFTMLTLTGLLSAGGFALAFLLKEQYGARSFFGLALLSVPVNFTVLGALFYSVFQFDSVTTAYPTVAHWTIASVASLGSTALIAAVVLIPVTLFAISIMGRVGRGWLSVALLFSSSMLLLPIRDTSLIAPIAVVLVIALIGLVKKRGEGVISLKTPSGRFVQSLLFLPPAIMLFRSFWLYDVSSLSAMLIALTLFAALRYAGLRIKPAGIVAYLLHIVSAIVAFVAAGLSVDVVSGGGEEYFAVLSFCIVFGGLMFDVEQRIHNKTMARFVSIGTCLSLAIVILFYQLFSSGVIVFTGGLVLSVAITGIGIVLKQWDKMLIGGLTLISILMLNAGGMVDLFMQTGWLGFASVGAIAILLASVIDRFGTMFSLQARRWFMSRSVQGES